MTGRLCLTRPLLAVLGAQVALVGMGSVATAATLSSDSTSASIPSEVWAFDPGMHGEPGGVVVLGSASANEVLIGTDPETSGFLVFDRAGAIPGEFFLGRRPCEPLDPFRVRCERLGPDLSAPLGRGDDKLRVRAPMPLTALGDQGKDTLIGSVRGDFVRGGIGGDLLRGRGGRDELQGKSGPDSVFGGPGSDRLFLANGDRDELINCGPGRDFVELDRDLDPIPHHCELLKRLPPPGR